MNKTLSLLVLFILLGGMTFWYLNRGADERTTLSGWDRDFKVEDTDQIYKIFLADRQGERITLERRSDDWLYNGQWKARANAMENLLDAVSRLEMQFKPPLAMVDGMVRDLATNGIKVELYDRQGELIKAYYVGGATADERGTYVIREGAEQPYVAHLPGWVGNLRFRYNLKGDDWRDKSLFDLDPAAIREVAVEYPKQKNKSFRVEQSAGAYLVRPFYDITPTIDEEPVRGLVSAFLTGFESLGAEAFENSNPRRDSVRQLVPFSIITVTDQQGARRSVRLFPILPKRGPFDSPPLEGADVVERYFADVSNGDFMLVQHRVVKKILWAYPFFFEAPQNNRTTPEQ